MDCSSQAPGSMGFPRQEYWSGLPFPSPGDLPVVGIKLASSEMAGIFLPLSHQGSPTTIFNGHLCYIYREGDGTPLQYSCLENPVDRGAWWDAVHGVTKSVTRLSDFTFTFHFHALEKEMATHFSILAWRIPGTGEPGGLPSLGSHRVGHDWSDLAAACYIYAIIQSAIRVRDKESLFSKMFSIIPMKIRKQVAK